MTGRGHDVDGSLKTALRMRSRADTHDISSQIHNKEDEVQADMRRCHASTVGFSPREWPRGLACTVARRAPAGQVAHRPTTSKQQALIARASQARVDRSCQLPVKLSRSQSGNNTIIRQRNTDPRCPAHARALRTCYDAGWVSPVKAV